MTQTCPTCRIPMTRRQSKYRDGFWWGCVNFPKCKATAAEHPDGTIASTPTDGKTKNLRQAAHKIAECVWGDWNKNTTDKKAQYEWMSKNSKAGHFGHMEKEELIATIRKLLDLLS